MVTLKDIRRKNREVQAVTNAFAAKLDGNGPVGITASPDKWQELEWAPGHFARLVPLQRNGISIIVWEIPEYQDFPKHQHAQEETFRMIRGRMDLEVDTGRGTIERIKLTPQTSPYTVPKRVRHAGTSHGNVVCICTYTPAMTIEEALTAVDR